MVKLQINFFTFNYLKFMDIYSIRKDKFKISSESEIMIES